MKVLNTIKRHAKKWNPFLRTTVIFCAEQGLPLWGHRDHNNMKKVNQENFLAIINTFAINLIQY